MKEPVKAALWREAKRRSCLLGGSEIRSITRGEIERDGPEDIHPLRLGLAATDPNERLYKGANFYIVSVSYATAVILMGWLPWNFLLLLPLLLGRNGHLRFREFETRRGSSL